MLGQAADEAQTTGSKGRGNLGGLPGGGVVWAPGKKAVEEQK